MPEETEEVEVSSTVSVIVPSVSILDQLAENVPWADDETWQAQPETDKSDETDDAAHVDDSISTPFVDEDGVHYLQDGHFWIEMPGLPPAEDPAPIPHIVTNGEPEPTRRNIRVRFTSDPIRGILELVQLSICFQDFFFFSLPE